jgi:transposase
MTQEALTAQDVDLYSPLDPSALPDDPVLLKKLLVQLISLLRRETKRREDVERNMDLLLRKLTSTRGESASPDQLNLFVTAPESAGNSPAASAEPATEAAAEPEPKRKARPHGRRKPPAHLEEREIVHDLPPELKRELGEQNLVPLPDVVSFQYDYQAAKLVVLRHVQKKYLRRDGDLPAAPATADASLPAPAANPASIADTTAPIADTPASAASDAESTEAAPPIELPHATTARATHAGVLDGVEEKILLAEKPKLPECEAAPGLLAYIWLSKYGDHLPLYRLESITERYGVHFTRSTTCGWMLLLADWLRPLWKWMCDEVRRSRVIHTDDTTVPLQDPITGQKSQARFWNYIGDEAHRLIVLEFTRTHERDGPARFLSDYQGDLQADAYNGYDGIYLDSKGRIIEVGCWQHARKRYKKAAQSDARAFAGLAFIKSMYAIEKSIRELRDTEWSNLPLDERAARIVEIRQRDTAPLLQSFREWINKTHGDVLPKSDLGDAFRYTLNQWDALNEFAKCGLLSIDNNPAERAHRGIAIGRKNWLHVGSERGGHAAAIHFSLIASCKLNGLDPFAYLVDILPRLAATPASELGQLAPHRWTKRAAASIG